MAPKAKIPARNFTSCGNERAKASTPAIVMATYGVPSFGCSRPTALGIWRLVASEYASRATPSIWPFIAVSRMAAASAPTEYRKRCLSHSGSSVDTMPSTGAST